MIHVPMPDTPPHTVRARLSATLRDTLRDAALEELSTEAFFLARPDQRWMVCLNAAASAEWMRARRFRPDRPPLPLWPGASAPRSPAPGEFTAGSAFLWLMPRDPALLAALGRGPLQRCGGLLLRTHLAPLALRAHLRALGRGSRVSRRDPMGWPDWSDPRQVRTLLAEGLTTDGREAFAAIDAWVLLPGASPEPDQPIEIGSPMVARSAGLPSLLLATAEPPGRYVRSDGTLRWRDAPAGNGPDGGSPFHLPLWPRPPDGRRLHALVPMRAPWLQLAIADGCSRDGEPDHPAPADLIPANHDSRRMNTHGTVGPDVPGTPPLARWRLDGPAPQAGAIGPGEPHHALSLGARAGPAGIAVPAPGVDHLLAVRLPRSGAMEASHARAEALRWPLTAWPAEQHLLRWRRDAIDRPIGADDPPAPARTWLTRETDGRLITAEADDRRIGLDAAVTAGLRRLAAGWQAHGLSLVHLQARPDMLVGDLALQWGHAFDEDAQPASSTAPPGRQSVSTTGLARAAPCLHWRTLGRLTGWRIGLRMRGLLTLAGARCWLTLSCDLDTPWAVNARGRWPPVDPATLPRCAFQHPCRVQVTPVLGGAGPRCVTAAEVELAPQISGAVGLRPAGPGLALFAEAWCGALSLRLWSRDPWRGESRHRLDLPAVPLLAWQFTG